MSVISGVGSPATVAAAGGSWILAFNNISTTPIQIIGLDPQRREITFVNPGSVNIYVAPTVIQNTGSDAPLTPSPSALGGCILVPAGGGMVTINGECQKPWQAFAATGSNNPFTVKVSRT